VTPIRAGVRFVGLLTALARPHIVLVKDNEMYDWWRKYVLSYIVDVITI